MPHILHCLNFSEESVSTNVKKVTFETVLEIPPTIESFSKTTDSTPTLQSSDAAVSPAGPAPMITTFLLSESIATIFIHSPEFIGTST